VSRDVGIVSFARTEPGLFGVEESETQLLFPIVNQALERAGITRKDVGFTCSASCDYLNGAPFAFVSTLEVTGAWPPISESHVEMDGAWALYEAWVRLQHGDIDVALVYSSGLTSRCNWSEVSSISLDPYYLMPLWPDDVSLASLQAKALVDAGKRSEAELDLSPPTMADGAAAVVLAAGDRARELCQRPAWIAGIDHRSDPHYMGVRDLSTSSSARLAGEQAGVGKGPVEVAELHTLFPHEDLILADAFGLGDDAQINPSGGARASNAVMVAGLTRIGEAATQIIEGGRKRTLGHATSGPCLQMNMAVVLEGDE
jgi:hypothetical protein